MTSFDRYERNLPDLLEALAAPRQPDYAEDLFTRTAATRQRPGWSFPERWLPVSSITQRLAAAPPIPWRLGALVALLVVAALVGLIVAGSRNSNVPAPYGPAGNGQIVYLDSSGRINVGDLATGTSRIIVSEQGNRAPTYSQDGTQLAFGRSALGGMVDLYVAEADGTNARKITTEPMTAPSYLGWSPSGDRLLAIDVEGNLLLFNASGAGLPTILSDGLVLGDVAIGPGYNTYQSTAAFRPPNGEEILVITGRDEQSLLAVRTDGSASRTLIGPGSSALGYSHLRGAEWSPDGSLLLVQLELQGQPDRWHTYVINADGSNAHPAGDVSADPLVDTNSARWSPDGTRIAFQYWTNQTDGTVDFHAIGIVDVASGTLTEVGPVQQDGFISWEWSPDGQSILMVPRSGDILMVNARTSVSVATPWNVADPIDWQRIALP